VGKEEVLVTDASVVFVTAPPDEATALARALVDESLAACVNIVPAVRSLYRWKGGICDDEESLLIIKTDSGRFEELKERIERLHSYEVPEVIALPVVAGAPRYLAWLQEQCGHQGGEG